MKKLIYLGITVIALTSSCSVIRPGEVGVKSRFGKLSEPKKEGLIAYNPFIARVIKLPTRTVNRELLINLPSKEGLTIQSEISILYKIKPEMAKQIITEIGLDYDKIVTAVFRSASADVTAKFYAKDMHSGERSIIEEQIAAKMNELLKDKGFEVESVLMKSITLPVGLSKAIEDKLAAEQDAQRMEFILLTEKKEAERKIIEAEGTRDAQKIVSEGLTKEILELRQIEMMEQLSTSQNAKVIVTNGTNTPVLIKE
jgi:regulator of protease activity HflC (stomatin/prohibitin superfamily)